MFVTPNTLAGAALCRYVVADTPGGPKLCDIINDFVEKVVKTP